MKKKEKPGAFPWNGITKLLRIMRLTFLIILIGLMKVSAVSYSQQSKLTMNVHNLALKDALGLIEDQSNYVFFYNADQIALEDKVDLNFVNKSINEILDGLLNGKEITYKVTDRRIVLYPKEIKSNSVQQKNVTGNVSDSSGQPLPGVSIIIKGTTIGTVTDFDGNFNLTNISTDATLVFSFVGMKTQEIVVGNQTVFNVTMTADAIGIEEVVAVGYGTQKKVNLTGSVSSVNFEKLSESRPITNISQGLAGQAAGVIITQSTGKPGDDDGAILIRGQGTLNNSSPLVVVDGIVGSLRDVIPGDIESVSILKDAASSSIYGSRAANGVILITTKKGSKGETKFTYNGYVGAQKPTLPLDMIWDYPTHMEIINQAHVNVGKPEIFSQATIDDYRAGTDPVLYPNTNWFEAAFRTALIQEHNLSATGGNDKLRYMFSANYLDNQGNMKETDYKKYSFRSNIEAEMNDWLTVGANLYGYWSDQGTPGSTILNYLGYIGNSVPGLLPRDPKGRVGGPWVEGEDASVNNIETNFDNAESSRNITKMMAKFYASLKLAKDLTLKSSFSPAYQYTYNKTQQLIANIWNLKTDEIIRQSNTKTALQEEYSKYYKIIFDSYLTYTKTIADKHNLGLILGYNQEYETSRNLNAFKLNLLADETTVMDAASGDNPTVRGTFADRALRSFLGRINYNYKEKYLFEANLRYDGSSKFSKNERWGAFPSFSAAWRISNEDFMSDMKSVSSLKLKASWGQLGNNRVADYGTQALYKLSNYTFGGSVVAGAAPKAIPNDILKWETTTHTGIGFEALLLNSKLGVDFDWFNKRTEDILINLPIPGINGGITAPPQNAGIVDNKGIELSLMWRNSIGNDFNYRFSGNFTYIKNEVVKYLGYVGTISGQKILQEGLPIGTWYIREVEGIATQEKIDQMVSDGYTFSPMPSPGDFIYIDQQKEGEDGYKVINDDDRVKKGSSLPQYIFGFSLDLEYKHFDLSVLAQGVGGIDAYFNNTLYTSDLSNGSLISSAALNAWTPENQNTDFPRLTAGGVANNTVANDFWLMDASYLRIKNITLGYSLPNQIAQKIYMNRCRVYLSAENWFTLKSSSFKGFDPEMPGVNYPIMKRLTIGLNINF